MKKLVLTLSLILAPVVAKAEANDAIVTDRPDFVESSVTVGAGRFQIETSVGYERDNNAETRSRTYGMPTLLRYGIAEDWELRLETDTYLHQRTQDLATGESSRENGWAEYALGVKWHQIDGNDQGKASVGWLFHLDMPGGSKSFESKRVRPSLRMVAEWELPDDYSFGVMPGVIYDVNEQNQRFWGGIFAATLGKSFTEKFRGFVEIAGQEITNKNNGGSQVTFDTGVAYLLTDYVQIDALYNRGLNNDTPDHTFDIGLSAKF